MTKSNVIFSLNFVLTIPEAEYGSQELVPKCLDLSNLVVSWFNENGCVLDSGIVNTNFKLKMTLLFVVFIFRFIDKFRFPQVNPFIQLSFS